MTYRERDEQAEERFQQAIADQLGISVEELDEWVVLEEEEFTDSGERVSHFVEFDKKTPSNILARMGLEPSGSRVKYLAPIQLDDEE